MRRVAVVAALALVGAAAVPAGAASPRISFVHVWAGTSTASAAITADGQVFTWGGNLKGGLGLDITTGDRSVPTRVTGIGEPSASVAVGSSHMLAATISGKVWGWGNNDDGQLGVGAATKSPRLIAGLPASDPVVSVWARHGVSAAVTRSGKLLAWGSAKSVLGVGRVPAAIPGLPVGEPIMDVALGVDHGLALSKSGRVWAWGGNDSGQLGLGDTAHRTVATQVSALPGTDHIVQVSAAGPASMALTKSGAVWTWGDNLSQQLGHSTGDSLVPRKVGAGLAGHKVVLVVAAVASSYAVTADGSVFSWGGNNANQLGYDAWNQPAPTRVGIAKVQDLSCGWEHCLALTADDGQWSWGSNTRGEGGLGAAGPLPSVTPKPMAAIYRSPTTLKVTLGKTAITWGQALEVKVAASSLTPMHLWGARVSATAGGVSASTLLTSAANGTVTLVLENLPLGTHTVSVGSTGASLSLPASVDGGKVSVTAKPRVAIVLGKKKVSQGKAVKVTVKVSVGTMKMSGKVRLQWGKKSRVVAVKKGKAVTRIKGLKPGRHTIRARFLATPTLKAAKAKAVKVRVVKKR